MTKQTVAVKIKLKKKDVPEFDELTQRFADACNYISQYIFDQIGKDKDFKLNRNNIHKTLYYLLREEFGLKSQLTASAIVCVIARYKTVKTQLEQNPWQYYDKTARKRYKIDRDLSWLKRPLHFKPQADLQRDRD